MILFLFINQTFGMMNNDPINYNYLNEYRVYLTKYKKNYTTTVDFWKHYNTYTKNVQIIDLHNSNLTNSWRMGINLFTDITSDEYKSKYLGVKIPNSTNYNRLIFKPSNVKIPDSIDWRAANLVTNIKDQGPCGSCWAFSAVGSIEGQHARRTGKLVSLSEQNLVDCAGRFGCRGCGGGWMNSAMEYVHYNNGIDTEVSYPYTALDGNCNYLKNSTGANVKNVVNISKGDTSSLLQAVYTIGPISIAIDTSDNFQFYSSGIYSSSECSKTYLDHAVLVVGYGVTPSGKKYYIIKNSWGASWGMNGYIYWDRDIEDMCGIAQAASYPVV